MKNLICFLFLLKSIFGRKFNEFDHNIAIEIAEFYEEYPSYCSYVAGLTMDCELPEVFADFRANLLEGVLSWAAKPWN